MKTMLGVAMGSLQGRFAGQDTDVIRSITIVRPVPADNDESEAFVEFPTRVILRTRSSTVFFCRSASSITV
jgi:hypothetical protein